MKYILFVKLLLIITPCLCSSDTLRRKSDAILFAQGVGRSYAKPFQWDRKSWSQAGLTLAATATLMVLDKPIQNFMQEREGRVWDELQEIGYHAGKPYSAFTATGIFWVGGKVLKNEWMEDTGLALAIGLLSSGLLQTAMKTAIGRARPLTESGPFRYKPFDGTIGYHSFPSGHMTVALGISYILARRFKPLGIKLLFYSLSAVTALSRLYIDAHWASDIFFGSVMAVGFGESAVRWVEANRRGKSAIQSKLSVKPTLNSFSLSYRL